MTYDGERVAEGQPTSDLLALGCDLPGAARRYVNHLTDLAQAAGSVDRLPAALTAWTSDRPVNLWHWVRFLADWPSWRPHRLERRLVWPPSSAVLDWLRRCREALAAPARRSAPPPDLAKLLREGLVLVAAWARPVAPDLQEQLDRAVPLGRVVDDALEALPSDGEVHRLARIGACLPDWPPEPDLAGLPGATDFWKLVGYLIREGIGQGDGTHLPGLLIVVLRETLDSAIPGTPAPPDDRFLAALRRVRDQGETFSAREWADALGELFRPATALPPGETLPDWWAEVRCLAYRVAIRSVPELLPRVDPRTGRPEVDLPSDAVACHYILSEVAPRTVLGVERFAVPPERGSVQVSLGPLLPGGAMTWLTVDTSSPPPGLPEGPWLELAAATRHSAEAEFWGRPSSPPLSKLVVAWLEWLNSEAGHEWFDALAHVAAGIGPAATSARRWLAGVMTTAGLACYPAVDPRTGQVSWPDDVPVMQPGIAWVADSSPPLTVLRVERFALGPQGAVARLSVGALSGPRVALGKLWNALCQGRLTRNIDDGLTALADRAIRDDPTAERPLLEALLGLLERLGLTTASDPQTLAAYDELLGSIRAWASEVGYAILPAEGGLASTARILAPADGVAFPEGIGVRPVFRQDVPAGHLVRIRRFGLVHEGQVVRRAELVISAGPPPPRLGELETAAAGIPEPEGEAFREALQGLRQAGAGGYLELAATDLYTRFWDHVYPEWSLIDPSACQAFADGLEGMMAEAFGLKVFRPARFQDYPQGWMLIPAGIPMVTGRVLRVLRPGLLRGEELHVPARVEVE